MEVACGSIARRIVINGGGDGDHFRPLSVGVTASTLHIPDGGMRYGPCVTAYATCGFLVHVTVDLGVVLRKHDEPFFVEDAHMFNPLLTADVVDDIAHSFPVGLEHCVSGRLYDGVGLIRFVVDCVVDQVGFHDRIEEHAADDNESGHRHCDRHYGSGCQAV